MGSTVTGNASVPGKAKKSKAPQGRKLDELTRKRVKQTLSFYPLTRTGCRACAYELGRQGIEIAECTLYDYISQAEGKQEILAIRAKTWGKLAEVPVFHRVFRLHKLQEILDDSATSRDKINALKEARVEVESYKEGMTKFSDDEFSRLPKAVQAVLESQCERIIEAEYSVVEENKDATDPPINGREPDTSVLQPATEGVEEEGGDSTERSNEDLLQKMLDTVQDAELVEDTESEGQTDFGEEGDRTGDFF